jgi:hypothetical protein
MSYQMEPISVTSATFALSKAHSGTEIFLNRAGGIAFTLPVPDAGLRYRFIIGTAPTSDCTIASNGGADIIVLGVNELEVDTGDDGPYDDNADLVSFKANVAVVGDFLDLYCDGTKWYGRGQTNADGGVTSATT